MAATFWVGVCAEFRNPAASAPNIPIVLATSQTPVISKHAPIEAARTPALRPRRQVTPWGPISSSGRDLESLTSVASQGNLR